MLKYLSIFNLICFSKKNTSCNAYDPLEQFNIFELFVHPEEYPILKFWSDNCPFNIIKMAHWVIFHVDLALKLLYYVLCKWVFTYLPTPTPSYLVILWITFSIVFVGLFILDNNSNLTVSSLEGTSIISSKASYIQYLQNTLNIVISSVLKSNTSLVRNEYLSILYFLFLFIFTANIFGLMPYTFTLTSSFMVTFFLAATHFVGINIIGIYKQSWHFLNIFLPSGVPLFIAPFLVFIEFVSYFAKVLSLSIRLFANMMSGHALLKILIGFVWAMWSTHCKFLIVVSFLPWFIVTIILFLEALIAFLQAYVFVVLVSIYLNDVTVSH